MNGWFAFSILLMLNIFYICWRIYKVFNIGTIENKNHELNKKVKQLEKDKKNYDKKLTENIASSRTAKLQLLEKLRVARNK